MNDPNDETLVAAQARIYARTDWRVFPCWWIEDGACACLRCACHVCARKAVEPGELCRTGSPGKHPIHTVAPRGVNSASADEATVAGWWTLYPSANIGLPAGDNGLAILDVDLAKPGGPESWARLNAYLDRVGQPLAPTLTARTGSGGRHYVFRAPEGGIKSGANVFGPDMPGIDTRGRGGYVIAPYSNHAAGALYEWEDFLVDEAEWPAILSQLMEPRPVPSRPSGGRDDGRLVDADAYSRTALERECDALASMAADSGRNHALNRAAFNLGQLVGAGLLDRAAVGDALLDAARSCGLGDVEATKTIRSGLRNGEARPRTRAA